LDPAAYLATWSQWGGGGDTLLYSNLKLIAVPVLATILHTAPLTLLKKKKGYLLLRYCTVCYKNIRTKLAKLAKWLEGTL